METGQAEDETTRAESDPSCAASMDGKATSELSSGSGEGRRSSLYTRLEPSSAGPGPHLEDSSLSPFSQQLPQPEVGALDGVHWTGFRGWGSCHRARRAGL